MARQSLLARTVSAPRFDSSAFMSYLNGMRLTILPTVSKMRLINRRVPWLALIVFSIVWATPAPAQRIAAARAPASAAQDTARLRAIFFSDTMNIGVASLSPDNKWIVFANKHPGDPAGTSIWLARAGSTTATRLTSDGYLDVGPRWFPNGKQIVFLSTRPARGPGAALSERGIRYAMVLSVDTAARAPIGVPRQVTTESTGGMLPVSYDGAWLAYIDSAYALKIVPTAGGPARTLVNTAERLQPDAWSPDGKLLYFEAKIQNPTEPWVLKSVSIATGEIKNIATGNALNPVPYLADLSKVAFLSPSGSAGNFPSNQPSRAELRDTAGNYVASLDLPASDDQQLSLGPGWHSARLDGRGVVFTINNSRRVIRTHAIDGSTVRDIAIDSTFNPVAFDAEGNLVGTIMGPDNRAPARLADGLPHLFVRTPDGRTVRDVKLPVDAIQIATDGVAGDLVTFRRSNELPETRKAVHAINVRTGVTQRLSGNAYGAGYGPRILNLPEWIDASSGLPSVSGPGGREQRESRDAFYLLEPREDGVDVRVVSATGASRVLRNIPKLSPQARPVPTAAAASLNMASIWIEDDSVAWVYSQPLWDVAASGDRVAWILSAPHDSITLMYSSSRSASPILLGTFSDSAQSIAFSDDGRHLALAANDRIAVFDLDGPGSARPRFLSMKPAVNCWRLRWAGPRNILAACSGRVVYAGPLRQNIYVRPLDPSGQAEPITGPESASADERDSDLANYRLSSDGRTINYRVRVGAGATIWTGEYLPSRSPVASVAGARLPPMPAKAPFEEIATLPVKATNVAVSPNGQFLHLTTDTALLVYDRARKTTAVVSRAEYTEVSASTTGDRIALLRTDANIKADDRDFVWTMPINPATGLRSGVERRVSMSPARTMRYSPDGKQIAYISAGDSSKLIIVPERGGAERVIASGPFWGPLRWSADGKWIYVSESQPTGMVVARVPAVGGSVQVLTPPVYNANPGLSPDQQFIVTIGGAVGRWSAPITVYDHGMHALSTLTLSLPYRAVDHAWAFRDLHLVMALQAPSGTLLIDVDLGAGLRQRTATSRR